MKKSILSNFLLCAGLLMTTSFSLHRPVRPAFRSAAGLPTATRTQAINELTPAERKFAVDYYVQTKARLLKDLKGLSPAQLNWKADSSRWSIAQCTEHIALAESYILGWIQMTAKQPANPEKKADVKMTTEQIIVMLTDRSHKLQAPEPIKPTGRFAGFQETENAFVSRRDSTIDYLKTTQDDLKSHYMVHPIFGAIDCYQGYIFLAAHSARHTLQIEEVMANPNFPKK